MVHYCFLFWSPDASVFREPFSPDFVFGQKIDKNSVTLSFVKLTEMGRQLRNVVTQLRLDYLFA